MRLKAPKFFTACIASLMVCLVPTSAFAESDVLKEQSLQEIYNNSINSGVSEEDAIYITKFTEKMRKDKKQNIIYDLSNTQALSDEYVRNNKAEYRKKVLEGDKQALLTELLAVDRVVFEGRKSLKEAYEAQKSKSKNEQVKKLTYEYPDGSKVSFSMEVGKTREQTEEVKPNYSPYYKGPWSQSEDFWSYYIDVDAAAGDYYVNVWWQFTTGTSFGKSTATMTFGWNPNTANTYSDNTVTYRSMSGGETFGGILELVSTGTTNNSGISSATGFNKYITGWYDSTFKVTGAITFNFGDYMSISLSPNYTFHNYSIIDIEGAGKITGYAGWLTL
jgi:hypothetical protein